MMGPGGWLGDRDIDADPCSRPVRTAYRAFVRDLAQQSGALHAYGWRVDVDEAYMHAVAGHNLPPGMQGVRVLPRASPTVAGDCLRERRPIHADHATAVRRYPVTAAFMQQLGARSMLALPVRGERLHGVISLGLPDDAPSGSLVTEMVQACEAWSPQAHSAEQEERLLEDEAWRSACTAALGSLDAGLSQVVKVLADAARFLPRKGPAVQHNRAGPPLEMPAPRDGLEPHRQAHLPGEQTRPAMVRSPAPPPSLHSMMDVPVLHSGVLLGHLQFGRSAMHGCFTPAHLQWAQEFAKCVAGAVRSGSR
ncbi:MAG TPA: GAF domain-containing protein [Candidatus Thermoplasmatota archaeon]|nr:GAF domain-containing protein [Candidatus Thermoplasmatota archaeon]